MSEPMMTLYQYRLRSFAVRGVQWAELRTALTVIAEELLEPARTGSDEARQWAVAPMESAIEEAYGEAIGALNRVLGDAVRKTEAEARGEPWPPS